MRQCEGRRSPEDEYGTSNMKVVRDGEKSDEEYDALPTDAMQPFDLPTRIRPDNPQYVQARRKLYISCRG